MEEYIVKKGDYLGKIAKQAGVSLQDLLGANPQIKDPDKIMVGQKIKLPSFGGGMPFQDEEEFDQVSYEEKIKEFFGHRIAMIKFPNVKKAKRKAEELQSELLQAHQQEEMDPNEAQQFFGGFEILKNLSYSLGGEYGAESAIERYLDKSEVRPINVKGYTVTKDDYQFFADAWASTALEHYGYTGNETSITGMPMKETTSSAKALHEYILNHEEKFEETPFGQIVVDEINKAVAEIPEIKLALDYLSEQDDPELEANTKKLGREYATAALNKARTEMVEKLPGIVAQIIDDMLAEVSPTE
tara:strand:+ start:1133 stop:2035 length:903 start_codon:yes stop_codon:yes gene_type:complete